MEYTAIKSKATDSMNSAVEHLKSGFAKLKTGKASPAMVEDLMVDYYGTPTPLSQVSNINTPDPKTISIQPWEKNLVVEIEKALTNSDLGLNGVNNGDSIMINVPALTEERRKEIVKLAKSEAENAKVSVRNSRRDANEAIKKLEKDGLSKDEAKIYEEEVQELTNGYIAKVDEAFATKEKELMKV